MDSNRNRDSLGHPIVKAWDLIDGDGYWVERFDTKEDAEFEAQRLTLKYDLDIYDPWTGEAKYPWYKVVSVDAGSNEDPNDRITVD